MLNEIECREQARRHAMMAAQTKDPRLKQRLAETAAGWMRVAADMARLDNQMAKLRIERERLSLKTGALT